MTDRHAPHLSRIIGLVGAVVAWALTLWLVITDGTWVQNSLEGSVTSVSTNLNALILCWLLGGLLAVIALFVKAASWRLCALLRFAAAAIGFIGVALVRDAAVVIVTVPHAQPIAEPTWLTRPLMLALWSPAALLLLVSGLLVLIRMRRVSASSA